MAVNVRAAAGQVNIMDEEIPIEIKKLEADHRGRVNLGTEYADETVRVALIEVIEAGEDDSTGEGGG